MLPRPPVARADAQCSVAVLLPSSADCQSSHSCVDASGGSRGIRRARSLVVLPAVDDRPGDSYQRDLIETHSHAAVRARLRAERILAAERLRSVRVMLYVVVAGVFLVVVVFVWANARARRQLEALNQSPDDMKRSGDIEQPPSSSGYLGAVD